jgi:very-short-patch-repair endonuclease
MRQFAKTICARQLRRDMTDAERVLWRRLRMLQMGVRFRRQHPLGPYIADFACLSHRLIVEVDGGQHCESAYDARRDRMLVDLGYRVLRFWNHEILLHTNEVCDHIHRSLHPHPPEDS